MGLKKFKSENREIVLLQENVDRALNEQRVATVQNGVLLSGIALVSGDNIIEHKLGRKILGYMIVRNSAASDFFDKISTDTDLDREFTLNSSAGCTVSLWVF